MEHDTIGGHLRARRPFAACGRNIDLLPDRGRLETVSSTRQVRVDALQKCLLKLKEYDRYLISLRYEQENPVKKIAEITGRSADGLYHTMARIHKTLLQCIHRTLNVWETAK